MRDFQLTLTKSNETSRIHGTGCRGGSREPNYLSIKSLRSWNESIRPIPTTKTQVGMGERINHQWPVRLRECYPEAAIESAMMSGWEKEGAQSLSVALPG